MAMGTKAASIRISEELWREAKILAVKEGITLSALLEDLLSAAVGGRRSRRASAGARPTIRP